MTLVKFIYKWFVNYWPVRFQAIVFLTVFVFIQQALGYFINDDASSYQAIATLLLKIVYAVTGGVLSFSVVSLLLPYFSNLFQAIKKPIHPELRPVSGNRTAFSIPKFLLPFLGSISVRLMPSEKSSSVLTVFQSEALIPFFMRGVLHWKQELVDLYRIQAIIIYHSDFLSLFRLPLKIDLQANLARWPQVDELKPRFVPVAVAKSEKFRIDELKKIEGEYLSYKTFEEGDDIRRIVWTIYARNRELVIRQPEIMNPYASHINFVPLFYSENLITAPQGVIRYYLSEYKQQVWKIYLELCAEGSEVRFQSSLTLDSHYGTDQKNIRDQITGAEWQSLNQTTILLPRKFPSVVVIPAIAPDEVVNALLIHPEITLVYIPMDFFALRKRPVLEKLFMNDNQSIRTIMDIWHVQPSYHQIQLRERQRLSMFKAYPQVKVLGNEVGNG